MEPQIRTTSGQVRGTVHNGVVRFLGIPYAASPTGQRRFGAPVPPEPWDGVRSAGEFGPTPPSPGYNPPYDRIIHQATVPGEDWLTVNVWTPEGAEGLPVMVWIHGGAFILGNSATPVYDGHAFARDGVVLVTVNYRLGVDGFAHLPDAPANRGLLDQVRALEWVQENIGAFGGDPARVTVFGESAGAMSVVSLMAMPGAHGLFSGAITQSGAAQAAAAPQDAAGVTGMLARLLGVDPTASALAAVGIPELLAAQRQVSDALSADPRQFGSSVADGGMAFVPVIDGEVLPEHPAEALASASAPPVPLLTGTTSEEFRFFLAPEGLVDAMTPEHLDGLAASRGFPAAVVDRYRGNRPAASPGDVAVALLTDAFFRVPALRLVEARPGRSWVYEFDWRSTHLGLGAAHAVEIPFVFDTLQAEHAEGLTGPAAPQVLADEMHAAWVRFATSGDPGWTAYDDERCVRVFRADGSTTERDPRGDERSAWG